MDVDDTGGFGLASVVVDDGVVVDANVQALSDGGVVVAVAVVVDAVVDVVIHVGDAEDDEAEAALSELEEVVHDSCHLGEPRQ
ncbi:hypothetical protein BGZ80_011444, partial [Entomortierella chlamydospora]